MFWPFKKRRCFVYYLSYKLYIFFISSLQSEGQILKEATYINKSLSFLEQAILALADHRRDHIPFRQTKLTHALKDSLGETAVPLLPNNTGTRLFLGQSNVFHCCGRRKLQHCACGQYLRWSCADRRNGTEHLIWYCVSQTQSLFNIHEVFLALNDNYYPCSSPLCVLPAEWSVSGVTLWLMNT